MKPQYKTLPNSINHRDAVLEPRTCHEAMFKKHIEEAKIHKLKYRVISVGENEAEATKWLCIEQNGINIQDLKNIGCSNIFEALEKWKYMGNSNEMVPQLEYEVHNKLINKMTNTQIRICLEYCIHNEIKGLSLILTSKIK
jgi:hypothetical protein